MLGGERAWQGGQQAGRWRKMAWEDWVLFPCAGDELSLLVAAELVGGDFECPVAAGSYVQYALVPGCPPQSSFPARLREYWSPSARPISHFGRLLATTVCLCTGRNACSIYSRETDYAAYWRGRPTPACNGSMVSLGGTRLRSYPPRIHIVPLHSGVKPVWHLCRDRRTLQSTRKRLRMAGQAAAQRHQTY